MSKAPLALMEQLLMTAVFALAAALCVQAFVFSDTASQATALCDGALRAAQNSAELLKSCHGDFMQAGAILQASAQEKSLTLRYDKNWEISPLGCYTLTAQRLPDVQEKLGKAEITLTDEAGKELLCLPVAWQEGSR